MEIDTYHFSFLWDWKKFNIQVWQHILSVKMSPVPGESADNVPFLEQNSQSLWNQDTLSCWPGLPTSRKRPVILPSSAKALGTSSLQHWLWWQDNEKWLKCLHMECFSDLERHTYKVWKSSMCRCRHSQGILFSEKSDMQACLQFAILCLIRKAVEENT